MGMYDEVEYETTCHVCGAKVDGFQSKDGECNLDKLQPSQVRNFYSMCPECDEWIEFDVVPSQAIQIIRVNGRRA